MSEESQLRVEVYSLRRFLPGGLLLLLPPLYLAYQVAAITPVNSFSFLDLIAMSAGMGIELFGFLSVIGWRKGVGAAAMVLPYIYAVYRDYSILLLPVPGFEQWLVVFVLAVFVVCGNVLVFWDNLLRLRERLTKRGKKQGRQEEEQERKE